MSSTTLDFLVIGASKSGTTSLFEHLRRHPSLYLPPEKEAPFFADERLFAMGFDRFLATHFTQAPETALRGTVTPQYLEDSQRSAQRICKELPEAKLIAILRNPIDRAYSSYRMRVMKGREKRSFEQVVAEQLAPSALERARSLSWSPQVTTDTYLVTSEYARMLRPFLARFARDQLHVTFTENLSTTPARVLDEIHAFLGVDPFAPDNLDQRYYRGGGRRRFTWALDFARRLRPLRFLWHQLSAQRRRALLWWLHSELMVDRSEKVKPMSPEIRAELKQFLAHDVAELRHFVHAAVPWPDFEDVWTQA